MSLIELVLKGDVTKVEEAIEELKKNPDELEAELNFDDDEKGWTPLFHAVNNKDDLMVATLLRAPGSSETLNLRDEEDYTVLHHAVNKDARTIVSMLIDSGAKINVKCKNSIYKGYTPLHFAVHRNNNERLTELLLTCKGIDVNAKNRKGQTPIHTCAIGGSASVVKILLNHPEVDPIARDKVGLTPLMLASATEREATVAVLLENKSIREHINDADEHGDTALHHAYQIQLQRMFNNGYPTSSSQDAVAYLLVRAGASLDTTNAEGTAPLLFPTETFASILRYVQKYGEALPSSLAEFLEADSGEIFKVASDSEDAKELAALHATYKGDTHKAAEENATKGPCPLITLVPRTAKTGNAGEKQQKQAEETNKEEELSAPLQPPKGHPSVEAGGDISACPFFSGKKKEQQAQQPATTTTTSTATATSVATPEPPKGHPNILGGDIGACPFFSKKKPGTSEAATAPSPTTPSTTTLATPSTTTTTTVASVQMGAGITDATVMKEKGKCPIPFHNQLVNPMFWLYLLILVVAVVIARYV